MIHKANTVIPVTVQPNGKVMVDQFGSSSKSFGTTEFVANRPDMSVDDIIDKLRKSEKGKCLDEVVIGSKIIRAEKCKSVVTTETYKVVGFAAILEPVGSEELPENCVEAAIELVDGVVRDEYSNYTPQNLR